MQARTARAMSGNMLDLSMQVKVFLRSNKQTVTIRRFSVGRYFLCGGGKGHFRKAAYQELLSTLHSLVMRKSFVKIR